MVFALIYSFSLSFLLCIDFYKIRKLLGFHIRKSIASQESKCNEEHLSQHAGPYIHTCSQ